MGIAVCGEVYMDWDVLYGVIVVVCVVGKMAGPNGGVSALISLRWVCVWGVCLHTLREQYRSQNCDIGGTTTTH